MKAISDKIKTKFEEVTKMSERQKHYDIEEDFSMSKDFETDLFDELVMDFDDDDDLDFDLETSEEPTNETENRMVDDIAGEVAVELTEEKEYSEENSEPEGEDEEQHRSVEDWDGDDFEAQPGDSDDDYQEKPKSEKKSSSIGTGHSSNKDQIWKYGKLWEFIRDLLKIPRFNPSVIR